MWNLEKKVLSMIRTRVAVPIFYDGNHYTTNIYIYIYIYIYSGDWGSIPGRIIPKTQKIIFDAALVISQHYKVRIKWSNPWNGVAPSSTPSNYWKESLWADLDKGHQLYLYIYRERERQGESRNWFTRASNRNVDSHGNAKYYSSKRKKWEEKIEDQESMTYSMPINPTDYF